MKITSKNMDRNILFKFKDLNNWYGLHTIGNNLYLERVVGSFNPQPDFYAPYVFDDNGTYDFAIDVDLDQVKVYINGSLIMTANISNYFLENYSAGLRASTGANSSSEVWFDNFKVTSLAPDNILPVPDLKQYDPLWGLEEYDAASMWAPGAATIERWGCVLTSAAMILQYYGFPISPGELNTWLNSQPDGYLRNGLANWLAISRYTEENRNTAGEALEFLRYGADDTLLTSELEAARPPIFKVPGHFGVAIGAEGANFAVNDPASATNTLLSQVEADHGGAYQNLYSYTLSSTDLSYLMLVVNEGFVINVFDADGHPVGESAIEAPLEDDIDGGADNGQPLNVFLLPQPPNGEYEIQINGNGFYQLDSYFYNREGEVHQDSQDGYASGQDTFRASLGEENGIDEEVSFESVIAEIEAAWQDGLITNRALYKSLRKLVATAQRFNQMPPRWHKYSRHYLEIALRYLDYFTPRLIDTEFSEILREELRTLLNSI
ncbi:hypothetical protein A2975_05315 [Candidatus Woesebacteria bacterium RIFCSPLOWO2_01_FULL_44_14]|uniref:Peptidase C39-like domain-containing protein n=1 Tax=Candidatus Woesebacteria bacterium RIFCSPLOWO2_01_FULL_44_14 TaxID=1802525 RepID=A0A1F8BZB1_9BACT|nr:MAG: hypothetical protein A2975_05315 [Candidatus Woesebacteria bacterium RIFCSPLOWO2_01_FULL_44_14]